jgi:hypothetical protein
MNWLASQHRLKLESATPVAGNHLIAWTKLKIDELFLFCRCYWRSAPIAAAYYESDGFILFEDDPAFSITTREPA